MPFLRFAATLVLVLSLVVFSGCTEAETAMDLDQLVRAIDENDRDTILSVLNRHDVRWNTRIRLSDDVEASLLDHFLRLGDAEVVAAIVNQDGASDYLRTCRALTRAVASCRIDFVDYFVTEYHSDFNCNPAGDAPPLFWGLSCSTEFAAALIERGADVNFRNEFGCTALHLACSRKDVELFGILLDHGADVNAKCSAGTPLHLAVCDATMMQALLESGASVNAGDADGNSPLHLAIYCDRAPSLVEEMLDAGASVNATNVNAETPLHLAARRVFVLDEDSVTILESLLDAGADIDARDAYGRTPLLSAASSGRASALRTLVEAGADLHTTDNEGKGLVDLSSRRYADPNKASGRDGYEVQQYVESLFASERD